MQHGEQTTIRGQAMVYLQQRGHAEVHSTVAERPTPRKMEKMKGRVNTQLFYPCSAWLDYCHDNCLIYQHRVGFVHSQPTNSMGE